MRTAIGTVLMLGAVLTGVPGVLLMRCCRAMADAARRWA